VRFDDYLMRMVQQLAQAVARIVKRLEAGEQAEAQTELSAAYDALLGGDRVFLGMVDAASPTCALLARRLSGSRCPRGPSR
jgi:hypothetical protein